MNENPSSPLIEQATGDKALMHRLMLFFAVVYVVEGLGQTGGLVSQPLNYYLKEVHGWTPVQVTAYVTIFNLPWIIKPVYGLISDFVPLKLSPHCQRGGGRRVSLDQPDHSAAPRRRCAADHGVRHGDIEHAVRGRAGGEWPKAA